MRCIPSSVALPCRPSHSRGARRLEAEAAAAYGLAQGAIVLVSALGGPAADALAAEQAADGVGGGVLAALKQEQEQQLAAELVAAAEEAGTVAEAAAAAATAAAPVGVAGEKHGLEGAAVEGAEAAALAKRVKLEPSAEGAGAADVCV